MASKPDSASGKKLLTAVERIVTSSENIRSTVRECEARVKGKSTVGKADTLRQFTATEIVRTYSNRAAIAGGVSGLPALIPGLGSLALSIGGGLAELTLLLKWEVEMALALSHVYGFDIDDPRERQLGFLLASVGTYDATGKNFFVDAMKVEGTALWNYGPRAMGKMVVSAMAMIAAIYVWRGFLKAVPFVGIAVGTSMNKVLTRKVGDRCMRDLRTRRDLLEGDRPAKAPGQAARKPKRKAKAKATARRVAAPKSGVPEESLN